MMWSQKVQIELESDTGGYDHQFVEEPPDSLKCLICLSVVKEPQQHGGCGKLFCRSCIARHIHVALKNDCPHCRQPLSNGSHTTIFNDFRSDQEVKSLMVCCDKCLAWKGELRALDEHKMKDCEHALVPCPNVCGNGQIRIMRKNLKSHLESKCPRRKQACQQCGQTVEFQSLSDHRRNKCPKRQYSCPHCNESGCYDERTTSHLGVCPKITIQCPKCSLQLFRCDNSKHLLTCTHEPVPCKYYNIGCMERPLRKDVIKHEEDAQLHLTIATNKVLQLTNTTLLKNTVTFKVTNFQRKKQASQCFYSPPCFTSKMGYKLGVRVDANGYGGCEGTHVSVFTYLMKGDNDDSLTWPFTGTVIIELLNQLEDKNHHKMTITLPAGSEYGKRVVVGEKGSGLGYPQFISQAALNPESPTNCQYLKDDALIFRVSAEASNYKPWLECTS